MLSLIEEMFEPRILKEKGTGKQESNAGQVSNNTQRTFY